MVKEARLEGLLGAFIKRFVFSVKITSIECHYFAKDGKGIWEEQLAREV